MGFLDHRRAFVGVVHLSPLPGAPRHRGGMGPVLERAAADARALAEGGCDALVVENFGDAPFHPSSVPAETVAALALAAAAARDASGLPLGINVLRNDALAALGVAAAVGAAFVRVNVLVGAAITDQGIVEGRAAEVLRARARLCPDVQVLADVHVKHATPMGDEPIEVAARDTLARGLADGLIVSGSATGDAPPLDDLVRVREVASGAAVLVGSGLDTANAAALLAHADGAIVGTALERDGRTGEPVDVARVRRMRAAFDAG